MARKSFKLESFYYGFKVKSRLLKPGKALSIFRRKIGIDYDLGMPTMFQT